MANLIRAKHPHLLENIYSFKDYRDFIENILLKNDSFSVKHDGISCSISYCNIKKK